LLGTTALHGLSDHTKHSQRK